MFPLINERGAPDHASAQSPGGMLVTCFTSAGTPRGHEVHGQLRARLAADTGHVAYLETDQDDATMDFTPTAVDRIVADYLAWVTVTVAITHCRKVEPCPSTSAQKVCVLRAAVPGPTAL